MTSPASTPRPADGLVDRVAAKILAERALVDAASRARHFLASFDRLGQNIDHEVIMTAVTMHDGEEVVGQLHTEDLRMLLDAVESQTRP